MNSTMSMPTCVVDNMGKVFQIGQEQYKLYKATRFVTVVADVLNKTIKTNQDAQKFLVINPLTSLSSSEDIKFRIGCSFRPEVVRGLFSFDFTGAPEFFEAKEKTATHSTVTRRNHRSALNHQEMKL